MNALGIAPPVTAGARRIVPEIVGMTTLCAYERDGAKSAAALGIVDNVTENADVTVGAFNAAPLPIAGSVTTYASVGGLRLKPAAIAGMFRLRMPPVTDGGFSTVPDIAGSCT